MLNEIPQAQKNVLRTLRAINASWRKADPEEMAPYLHRDIVMVFPGFSGRTEGKDAFLAGFKEFCEIGVLHAYKESNHMVDVTGKTAVASYLFDMQYEMKGEHYRSTGRDLWIFEQNGDSWTAVWRTMFDLKEESVKTE